MEKIYFNGAHDDIGVNASNKKFFENHPDADMPEQIYPLTNFRLSEWEIVEE